MGGRHAMIHHVQGSPLCMHAWQAYRPAGVSTSASHWHPGRGCRPPLRMRRQIHGGLRVILIHP